MADTVKDAVLVRMVMPDHICPYGLKARDLLQHRGYAVQEHWLTTRGEVDAFKAEQHVTSTPQTFIDGRRVGGYDDLRRFFGLAVRKPGEVSYRPVLAVFGVSALMALAATYTTDGTVLSLRAVGWFVAFSMCVLALLKLQDIESFATMFLNYDLLARRVVRYGYVYPFAELLAGLLMIAGVLWWLSVPVAAFIGTIGAVSVVKAVYLDRRDLKCACVGGSSRVPLGFVSLLENVMMAFMAAWTLWRHC